jgi:hypothetical protein
MVNPTSKKLCFFAISNNNICGCGWEHSFETRSTRGWNRAELMKKYEKSWPGRPGGLTRQNPVVTRWLLFFY